jgi:hypothetical protein
MQNLHHQKSKYCCYYYFSGCPSILFWHIPVSNQDFNISAYLLLNYAHIFKHNFMNITLFFPVAH